ncbi:hypothetical protein PsorP6_007826 [Peronosclerospora sorghi]|uniref:Uncharacterized protein n=1 Tax=Peronosclerospora sorghi TaxID=230839 RepID=A0ACC0W832_9STRA|nr:hypothetical protein PsorP6_007826 [Peronosclerospora sorghi]
MDARFEAFETDPAVAELFSRARIHFYRSHLSQADERVLNTALTTVLDALSGYFLVDATHHVLEFLVRRYEIHRYNVDAVMGTILAYHESTWFVRMVRILHLRPTRWAFLVHTKTHATPLVRAALVQRTIQDPSVVHFLFDTITRVRAQNPQLPSLYALVLLQVLDQTKVTEAMLRWFAPQLVDALKSVAFPEFQSVGYMLVTKLASKATLASKLVHVLVKTLLKYAHHGAHLNALLCVVFLAQTQPSFRLSRKAVNHLMTMDHVLDLIRDAASQYELTRFVHTLVAFLTQHLETTVDEHFSFLTDMIAQLPVLEHIVDEMIDLIVHEAEHEAFDTAKPRVEALASAVMAWSRHYARQVDDRVTHLLLQTNRHPHLPSFVTYTFKNMPASAHFVQHQPNATTSVALALDHPTAHIRYDAVRALAAQTDALEQETKRVVTSGEVLLNRILDDHAPIVTLMLSSSVSELLLSVHPPEQVLATLIKALDKWHQANEHALVDTIVSFLVTKYRHVAASEATDEHLMTVFVSLACKSILSFDQVCPALVQLEHPFCVALQSKHALQVNTTSTLAHCFGRVLATDVATLLPVVLKWNEPSQGTTDPVQAFVVEVLAAASDEVPPTSTDKKLLLLPFVAMLQHAFGAVCRTLDDETRATTEWGVTLATHLARVAHDLWTIARDEFYTCVQLMLEATRHVFEHVQASVGHVFRDSLAREVVPTMARFVATQSSPRHQSRVQTRALAILSAAFQAFVDVPCAPAPHELVPVVAMLLVALAEPHRAVRQAAVACLAHWTEWAATSNSRDARVLVKAMRHVLHAKEELVMDATSVRVQCGSYSEQPQSRAFFHLLLQGITAADDDRAIAGHVLPLLTQVRHTSLWLETVEVVHETLATGAMDDATSNMLSTLLERYLDPKIALAGDTTLFPKAMLDALLAVLRSNQPGMTPLQALVAAKLSVEVYEALDEASRQEVVATLLSLVLTAEEGVASNAMACLTRVPIGSGMFARLLEEQRTAPQVNMSTLSGMLEVLAVQLEHEASKEETDDGTNKLLRTLCHVLAFCSDPPVNTSISDYLVQVLCNCLRRVCQAKAQFTSGRGPKSTTHAPPVERERVIEHTLTCLRRASLPQTWYDGLLFLSAFVLLFPENVLASLEPIVHFLSTSALRLDEAYAFQVVETLVLAAVAHVPSTASDAMQSFLHVIVDMVPRLGRAKRVVLLNRVVQALGTEKALATCIVVLVEDALQVNDRAHEQIQLAHDLCHGFACPDQVSCLERIVRVARELLPLMMETSETDTDEMEEEDEEEEEKDALRFVFKPDIVQSTERARQLNAKLLAFIRAHLRARPLHAQLVKYEQEHAPDALQAPYLRLAQAALVYYRRVAREESALSDEHGFWSALAADCLDVLSALEALLATPGFLALISELLHHDASLVRKKAMQLFNARLSHVRETLGRSERLLFLDLVDELDIILQNGDKTETTVNLQTALLSVDILARHFATTERTRFEPILSTLVTYVDIDVRQCSAMALHLFGCAFVCLSSIARALGATVLPYLPTVFPRLLSGIASCSSTTGTSSVLQCLVSALEVLTDTLPQFLTPYVTPLFETLLTPRLLTPSPVLLSVDSSLLNLCHHVELRHLLPTFVRVYDHVLTCESETSVTKFFGLVDTVVCELETVAVRQHLSCLARFFVTALDLRRVHRAKVAQVDKIEDAVVACLVHFILKLSEKQLKPLFLKLTEWTQMRVGGRAGGTLGDLSRRITFVKVLIQLADQLRGIFVPYYIHVLEFLTACLNESREVLMRIKPVRAFEEKESEDEDDFFAKDVDEPVTKKAKVMSASNDDSEYHEHTMLLQLVVRALDGCFVHDTDGFIEKERFDLVLTPLVDVLDVLRWHGSMRAFVLETVTHCLANLAWAAKSDLLWKPLHYAVLMKSRQDVAAVRLAALVTVEKCYQVIGDEFLAMLPESIPFLAELMEDRCPEVEKTCHRVIKQIEDISGESLDQYLTT